MGISNSRAPRLATEYGVASGGTETDITVAGVGYKLHTFTATGSLVVTTPGWFDVIVAGGGGGGGKGRGGGGGAGGLIRLLSVLGGTEQRPREAEIRGATEHRHVLRHW